MSKEIRDTRNKIDNLIESFPVVDGNVEVRDQINPLLSKDVINSNTERALRLEKDLKEYNEHLRNIFGDDELHIDK